MIGLIEMNPTLCTLEYSSKKRKNLLAESRVPFIISDAAMLHGLSAYSSSALDTLSGRTTASAKTLVHRVNAIRLINESLNDTR